MKPFVRIFVFLAAVMAVNHLRAATVQSVYGPATPASGLFPAPDGYFYGTTRYGGSRDFGTVFKVSGGGAYQLLYSFTNGPDGAFPATGLTLGPDGLLYGTCQHGGPQNAGSIFKITAGGILTVLHTFTGADGSEPVGALVVGTNNLLYGAASTGGAHGCGRVFQLATNGAFAGLYDFWGTNGSAPASLTVGTDGLLYGVTQTGGVGNCGTIFKLAANGSFTSLFSFSQTNGSFPAAPLIQTPDGFYGVTPYGGTNGFGAVFKITPAGVFALLHSLKQISLGLNPSGSLAVDGNGNLCGGAGHGGANGFGSLFQVTPMGVVTSLYDFGGAAGGGNPATALTRVGFDFYGANTIAGTNNGGSIFRMTALHFDTVAQALPGRKLRFTGSGGSAGGPYNIFSTTNPGVGRTFWELAGSGFFTTNGLFSFTNTATDNRRLYFVLQLP